MLIPELIFAVGFSLGNPVLFSKISCCWWVRTSEHIIADAACVTIALVLWIRKKNCRCWNKEWYTRRPQYTQKKSYEKPKIEWAKRLQKRGKVPSFDELLTYVTPIVAKRKNITWGTVTPSQRLSNKHSHWPMVLTTWNFLFGHMCCSVGGR
jgi:hypothetical protein